MAAVLRSQARVFLLIFFGCPRAHDDKIWDILAHDIQVLPVKSYIADNGFLETNYYEFMIIHAV